MKLLARIICKGASLEVSQVQSEFGGAHSSSAAHGNLMPCRPDTLMAPRTYFFEGHAAVLFCSFGVGFKTSVDLQVSPLTKCKRTGTLMD